MGQALVVGRHLLLPSSIKLYPGSHDKHSPLVGPVHIEQGLTQSLHVNDVESKY